MRHCECGKVVGQYVNNLEAEISDYGYSIAIGNGSLLNAISDMTTHKTQTQNKAERSEYYEKGKGKIEYAWVRPNDGPGNPHTKVVYKEVTGGNAANA